MKINGVDTKSFGYTEARINATPEAMPLMGFFDLPKRNGTTHKVWKTGEIDPFVLPTDIVYQRRELKIQLSSTQGGNIEGLKAALKGVVAIEVKGFSVECSLKSLSNVSRGDGWNDLALTFEEQEPKKYSHYTYLSAYESGDSLDGVSFATMGFIVQQNQDEDNISYARIQFTDSSFFYGYLNESSISVSGTISCNSLSELSAYSARLNGLLNHKGLHRLVIGGKMYQGFAKEGVKYSKISGLHHLWASVTFKLILVK